MLEPDNNLVSLCCRIVSVHAQYTEYCVDMDLCASSAFIPLDLTCQSKCISVNQSFMINSFLYSICNVLMNAIIDNGNNLYSYMACAGRE